MFKWLKKIFKKKEIKNCTTCIYAKEDAYRNHFNCKYNFSKDDLQIHANYQKKTTLLADFDDYYLFPCDLYKNGKN